MSGPAAAVVFAHALSVSIPSTDGLRGAEVIYERWVPEHRLVLGASGSLRETAAGDYTAVTPGAGIGVRHFWRAHENPRGWFYGGDVHVSTTLTHDDVDDEWLGTTLTLGLGTEIGYRIVPWRQLIVTGAVGLEAHSDIDTSGRLPARELAGFTVGLEIGWRF